MKCIKIKFTKRVRKKLKKLGFVTELRGWHKIWEDFRVELPCKMQDALTSNVGAVSYIREGFVCDSKIKIGRFCSIGKNAEFAVGGHRLDLISTSPYFSQTDFHGWNKDIKRDFPKDFWKDDFAIKDYPGDDLPIEIGDDVWICSGVKITKAGIKIGNGAVIGRDSIVTKDVPDFAIVAGNPARIKKYRLIQKKFADKYQPWGILTYEDFKQFLPLRKKILNFFRNIVQ